ncbi:hypothetical protein SR41_10975 [Sphingomonas melonis]|uniref:Uncharacterized protein n=1 Tax=Sphingomonas melonis TaxID=152682 RepID=A0A0D1MHX9_9SPHN|nr:hypothetical protein SR41_10975 [Sphingomonas melonis]
MVEHQPIAGAARRGAAARDDAGREGRSGFAAVYVRHVRGVRAKRPRRQGRIAAVRHRSCDHQPAAKGGGGENAAEDPADLRL